MKIVDSIETMSRRYADSLTLCCPVCGADMNEEGSYGDASFEGAFVYQQTHCCACGSTWTTKYELYEIDDIDLGPGYVWEDPKEVDPHDRGERPDRAA